MSNWYWFIYTQQLTQLLDYVGGQQPIYIGEALQGSSSSASAWRIKKLTYDGNGNVTELKWSPKSLNFGDIWDNRAGYSYS